jgi:hypothetical protein
MVTEKEYSNYTCLLLALRPKQLALKSLNLIFHFAISGTQLLVFTFGSLAFVDHSNPAQ